jgi:hypothetical protein
MLAAAVFGVFTIPMLYVVFQQTREWVGGAPKPAPVAVEPKAGAPEPGE